MKLTIKSFLVLACGLLLSSAAPAQVRINVNVGPPAWGPAVGPSVEYYYLPEIDGYYDLYSQQYVFLDNGYWVSSPYLPPVYADYDPRYFHPIVVDYIGRRPWEYIRSHRDVCVRYGVTPGRYFVPGRAGYVPRQPYYGSGRGYGYGYDQRPQGYNPGYGRGYDNDRRYDTNRGYTDNRGYDNNRGYENRGADNRGYGNRGADNRASDNRGYENRGTDNRSVDNRGSDNRSSDNRVIEDRGDHSGRGRIR